MNPYGKINGIFLAFQKIFLKKGEKSNKNGTLAQEVYENKQEHTKLLKELEQVKIMLDQANTEFNSQINSDLIESCIYNIEALETKYNYLIKEARKQNIKCDAKIICVTG